MCEADCVGGLQTLLMRKDVLSLEETRFYIAQTIMALEAIHKHNYIHRQASALHYHGPQHMLSIPWDDNHISRHAI